MRSCNDWRASTRPCLRSVSRNSMPDQNGASGGRRCRCDAFSFAIRDCPATINQCQSWLGERLQKTCPDAQPNEVRLAALREQKGRLVDALVAGVVDQEMRLRKKVEMLFAHLKRILGLGRLRLSGPCGANDEFLLAATAQNLRKLAKIFPAPQQTRKA